MKRTLTSFFLFLILLLTYGVSAKADLKLKEFDYWYKLESDGDWIGYYHVESRKGGAGEFRLKEVFVIKIKSWLYSYNYNRQSEATLDQKGVIRYTINENSDGSIKKSSGERKGNNLELEIENSKSKKEVVNVSAFDSNSFSQHFLYENNSNEAKKIVKEKVLDLLSGKISVTTVRFQGEKKVNWAGREQKVSVIQTSDGSSKEISWLDQNGTVLFTKGEDFSMRLTDRKKALKK